MAAIPFQGLLTLQIEILETILHDHLDLKDRLVLIGTCPRMHNTFANIFLVVVKVSIPDNSDC